MFMDEAYRPVTMREGEKLIELPGAQAVFRSIKHAAIKGDRWAQRHFVEKLQQIESSDRQERVENFTTMVKYQTDGRHSIARARASGLPEPDLVPHPDDIIIDMITGDSVICGPVTPDDKAVWDDMLAWRDSLQGDISACAASHDHEEAPHQGDGNLARWHRLQAHYDMINDNLPPRYRKELADRSFAEGATWPGGQKSRQWPGE
jgi:hypothetical protein